MTPEPDGHRVLALVWRQEAPHVLAALLRRHGDLGDCEDAAQEAAEAAARQWPDQGVPTDPRGWLVRVASRRLIDRVRAESARTRREALNAALDPARPGTGRHGAGVDSDDDGADNRADGDDGVDGVDGGGDGAGEGGGGGGGDSGDGDVLRMLLLCCHPALSRTSQVALSLRAVGGIGVPAIAAAFGVPARTMTQRLTRARATLRTSGARFEMPSPADLPARVGTVLDVCYLVFTVGYTRTEGRDLLDLELVDEAIRLTRLLRAAIPDHDEVTGALSLMLLVHARTPARTDEVGDLVPLSEQDRTRWRHELIDEGRRMLERTLPRGHVGRFQLEAAIAAVHADATRYSDTDWPQISMLYDMLAAIAPGPVVTLNHAVAVAMAHGPRAGLLMTEPLLDDPAMRDHHRLPAVRGHLLDMLGDTAAAAEQYRRAAQLATSIPEQRYLNRRLRAAGYS